MYPEHWAAQYKNLAFYVISWQQPIKQSFSDVLQS